MKSLFLPLTMVLATSFSNLAYGLEIVNDARVCTSTSGLVKNVSVVFLDGVFTGIRFEDNKSVILVRYNEDETGMQLVNPMEFNMEKQADISAYSQVSLVSPDEAVKMRAHENFSFSNGPTVEIGQTSYSCVK